MKKFLESLNHSLIHRQSNVPAGEDAQSRYAVLYRKFSRLIGHRALYRSRGVRESRVVTIDAVGKRFISVSYPCYDGDVERRVSTSITYNSIICGDDKLDVEE